MSKTTTPAKFFVGRTKTDKGDRRFHVFRQRVTGRLIKKTVVEVMQKDWTAVKRKFSRASRLFLTRAEARREKLFCEGRA